MTLPPSLANYGQVLNTLFTMRRTPYYATRKAELLAAENAILELGAEVQRLRDRHEPQPFPHSPKNECDD